MRFEPTPDEPTQKTRPKKGRPIDIPIPKHDDVFGVLRKVAPPVRRPSDEAERPRDPE